MIELILMAINSWLSKLKTQEKEQKETFFALEITQETVKSAVWTVENKEALVLKVGTIEDRKEEDKGSFLKAVDASISSSGEGISPEPKGILFGLPEDWAENQVIVAEKKKWLKEICDKLELKPLGFVVTTEALIQYFKSQQGTPLNGILIRIGEADLLINLILTGKIISSEIVGRTEDLVADVREGLARFSEENLPPRMILYNGIMDFEDAKQQLLSFDWQKELPFLHFPKIESLSREISIRSVAIAGGAEVAKSLGLDVAETSLEEEVTEASEIPESSREERILTQEESQAIPLAPVKEQKGIEEEGEIGEEVAKEDQETKLENLGFVKDEDILRQKQEPEEQKKEEKETVKVKGESLLVKEEKTKPIQKEEDLVESEPEEKKTAVPFSAIGMSIKNLGVEILEKIQLPIRQSWQMPFSGIKAILLLAGLLIVGLVGAGFAFYWYFPSAEVVISVKPKILEKDIKVQVSTSADTVDLGEAIIPGKERETEKEGSLMVSTTGKKLIGEKAKGTITVLNKTENKKTFEKGAVLVGSDNLRFELTEDVTVASRSAEQVADGEKITYGKADADLVAADIGPEYNLQSGEELTFRDFSSSKYSTKTEQGLSGGTSREIQAVSKEDQENALEKLTNQLKSESLANLKSDSGDEEVFEEGIVAEVVEKSYDKKVGEEADNLNLDLKLRLRALSFSKNDLNTLLLTSLSESVPEGFQLETEDIESRVDEVELEDNQATLALFMRAKLLPRYNVEELRDNFVGKYPPLVQEYLTTLPNFVKADIKISPNLPGKLKTLPRIKEKIKIKLEAID